MNVIIRLQNLPWSANAADIRAYFSGLSIPEGGVHIVGGEQGDAFIAFSTDEDARQAMLRDGGKLKEVKIKLFLSSRTEMLRIIEQARQQTLNLQSIIQGTHLPVSGGGGGAAAAAAPAPAPAPSAPVPSLPVAINSYETGGDTRDSLKDDDEERSRDDDDSMHRDRRDRRGDRDRSGSRDRGRSDRSRDRDRDRGRRDRDRGDRDRDRGDRDRRGRRERSKSRDRWGRRRNSRSRDRERRRSREKEFGRGRRRESEQEGEDKGAGEGNGGLRRGAAPGEGAGGAGFGAGKEGGPQQMGAQGRGGMAQPINQPVLGNSGMPSHLQPAQQSPILNQPTLWEPSQQPKPALLPDPIMPQMNLHQMQNQRKESTPPHQGPGGKQQGGMMMGFHDQDRRPFGPPQFAQMGPRVGREGWMDPLRAQPMDPRMRQPSFPPQFPMQYGMMPQPQYQSVPMNVGLENKGSPEPPSKPWINNSDEADICIEIRGLPLNVTYVDVKRLFDGLSIPPDGIKMINDNHGNRTGIAYVKFTNPAHKRLALNQNGKKVRSSVVEVLHLKESLYKTAVDNFKPEKDVIIKTEDMDIDNGDMTEEQWKRDQDQPKKGMYQDPRLSKKEMAKQMAPDSPRKEKPRYNCLIIKGLPLQTNERDIFDFFSELGVAPLQVSFSYDQMGQPLGDAFCQFETAEEAEKAVTKDKSNMGRNIVSVFLVPSNEVELNKPFPIEPYVPYGRQPYGNTMRNQPNYPAMRMPEMPMGSGGGDRGGYYGGDRGGGGDGGGSRYGGGMGGGGDRYMGDMGPMPLMDNGNSGGGGRGSRGRGGRGGPNRRPYRRNTRASSPYIDGETLDRFGQPGCVVALENIHFKADIDEIMDFFDGFDIEHESVIRRFDDNGRATGDARVALKSPSEASRAVRQLLYKTIRGRPIKLSIVP